METTTIKISKVLNSVFAVTTEQGEIIFKKINKSFKKNDSAILDFAELEIIISTFLNASVGQLYGYYESEFIKNNLSIINLSNADLTVLAKVIERAKQYFKDKKSFENLINNSRSESKQDNKN